MCDLINILMISAVIILVLANIRIQRYSDEQLPHVPPFEGFEETRASRYSMALFNHQMAVIYRMD